MAPPAQAIGDDRPIVVPHEDIIGFLTANLPIDDPDRQRFQQLVADHSNLFERVFTKNIFPHGRVWDEKDQKYVAPCTTFIVPVPRTAGCSDVPLVTRAPVRECEAFLNRASRYLVAVKDDLLDQTAAEPISVSREARTPPERSGPSPSQSTVRPTKPTAGPSGLGTVIRAGSFNVSEMKQTPQPRGETVRPSKPKS